MTAPAPSHMSTVTPNFHVYWDSTMLGTLKECPKRFHYQHILGYQPKGLNTHLFFGQLYHAGIERYDHARAAGTDHDTSTREMVRWVLTASGERDAEGTFTPWLPTAPNEYGDIKPDTIKNRYTLVRSLVWAVEEHRDSPLRTVILANGKPAVELSFRFSAFEISREPITLCGHFDRVVQDTSGDSWVYDHKTTKGQLNAQYFRQFTPHNQFSLYTIAGRVVLDIPVRGVLVNGVQIGVNFNRFTTAQVPRPTAVLEEWLADAEYWIGQARGFARADHWPMNDKSCGNYGGCSFQKVCALSPTHRKAWLDSDFAAWGWNPLIIRGDI